VEYVAVTTPYADVYNTYVDGFPWWPAVVLEFDDETIPTELLSKKTQEEIAEEHLHVVRFFDDQNSSSVRSPNVRKKERGLTIEQAVNTCKRYTDVWRV
jgi:hypothetical protein